MSEIGGGQIVNFLFRSQRAVIDDILFNVDFKLIFEFVSGRGVIIVEIWI